MVALVKNCPTVSYQDYTLRHPPTQPPPPPPPDTLIRSSEVFESIANYSDTSH